MRIAFAGGSTGGHVFPIRALIQHINSHEKYKRKASSLVWFGERKSLEESTAKEFSDVKFISIVSGKLRRSPSIIESFKNISDLFRLMRGMLQCIWLLKKHRIDTIFCKGGYVSLPVVIAGRILRKNIILHESDTQAGLSNKVCARFATTIFTGFAGVFPGKERVIGQILSHDLIGDRRSNTQSSEISNPQLTKILVTGGSQGAESVYRPLSELIRKNGYKKSHFYVVLGMKNIGLRSAFEGLSNVTCYDFIEQVQMGRLLAECDAAITRAGTTSLAEEKLFGLKLVMVPIPWTHDQLKNAQYYASHYHDILVKQDDSFLLTLPTALEQIQEYKKEWQDHDLQEKIEKPKDIICDEIFRIA